MKAKCDGSGKPGIAKGFYPHCPECGREFSAQGRKAQARLGNPWLAVPVHFKVAAMREP